MKLKAAPYVINLMTEEEQIYNINTYNSQVATYIDNPSAKVIDAHFNKHKTNIRKRDKATPIPQISFLHPEYYSIINFTGLINDEYNNFVYNKELPFEVYEYIFSSYWIRHLTINFDIVKAEPDILLKLKSLYMQSMI